MTKMILDSSALIASIDEEKGKEVVDRYLPYAVMSTVNITEVATYMMRRDRMDLRKVRTIVDNLLLEIVPYDEEQAFLAAELCAKTKHKGLSLGDRACLALAITRDLPVLTADKAWKELQVGAKIQVIR